MKKFFPFAMVLASIAAVPSAASALESQQDFRVAIVTRDRGDVDVGTIRFEPSEAVDFSDESLGGLDNDNLLTCRYFAAWRNNVDDLPTRVNLVVDEVATVSNADCLENAEENFDTIIFNASEFESRAFDRAQQRRTLNALILGESENGEFHGVIQLCPGGVYSITLDAC